MASEEYLIKIQLQIQNDKQLKTLTTNLQKAAKQAPKTAQAMKRASSNTKNFGNIAQNTGYQIQDMAVQIQGGVDPMRAMSQQLPQMLVGFGAWGAAIGVVAALMPSLITLVSEAEEEIEGFSDAVNDLESALSGMQSFTSGMDFNSWNESWNSASEAVRKTELALLEFRITAAKGKFATAVKSGAQEVNGELSKTQTLLASISDWFYQIDNSAEVLKDINVAETMGIDRSTVDQLQAIFSEFQKGAKTAGEMRDAMLSLGKGIEDANPEFYELVESMNAMAVATERMAEARKQAAAASKGGDLPVAGGASGSSGGGVSPAVQAAIDLNDYNQMLIEAELGQEAFNATLAKSAEEYTVMDESMDIFLNTFDSAVDGVARGTQSMSDAFESMAKSILLQIGKLLAIQGIGTALSGQSGFLGQVGASLLAEKGAVVSDGHHVTAYANGGVVNGPTLFPMAKGTGLMGEAGAEAIMPLSRMSNGNLGVESSGMNVVINNNASGVQVNPRQTDEGLTIDVVMSAVSQAVRRGGNEVAESFEQSYALNRGKAVYGN